MSNSTIPVKDAITFTLNEADLTGKKVGDSISTPKRVVPCSDGLQWWIEYSPAGWKEAHKDHLSVFLLVNKPVKATFDFAVDGSSISGADTKEFKDPLDAFGYFEFASHEQLHPLFRDGKLTIECSVEFDIQAPGFPIPRIFQLFEHVPTDVEFVIGSEIVPAHKSFLALISPVFQAMFTHDTAESKSSKIVITEFDFVTVNAAIDFCYGRQLTELSVEIVVNILRFADKYLMTAVINELEKLPLLNPSIPTFCTVIRYAYDCNRNSLLTTCFNFFKEHQDEIITMPKFAELPLALVVDTLKAAFGLKTDFEVLRHAHKNGIDFVKTDLEKPLLRSLTLDNFCDAVSYAWDCSRDELKKACAKFLNNNRDDVWSLKALNDLPVDVIGKFINARYILDHGDD